MSLINHKQAIRYSRQISLQGFDLEKQELLFKKKVLIVGMGGLGCPVAQYIVAAGIGIITLNDDDVIELSNLQRQPLYTESDIGQFKALVAKNALSKIRSDAQINTITQRLDFEELNEQVSEHDLVIDCSDNISTRNAINQACYASKTPLVCGAAIRMEGHVFSVTPLSNSACYACISALFKAPELSCSESGVLAPVVGVIGAMQATEAIKILTNYGTLNTNQLHVYDALAGLWNRFEVPKLPTCQVCGKPQ